MARPGWLLSLAAVAAAALAACWNFRAGEQAFCDRPGTFCFDGGSPDDAGDSGRQDGETDAGADAGHPGGTLLMHSVRGRDVRYESVAGLAPGPGGSVWMGGVCYSVTELMTAPGDEYAEGYLGQVAANGGYTAVADVTGAGDEMVTALASEGPTAYFVGQLKWSYPDGGTFRSAKPSVSLVPAPGARSGFLAQASSAGLNFAAPIASAGEDGGEVEPLALSPGAAGVLVSGVVRGPIGMGDAGPPFLANLDGEGFLGLWSPTGAEVWSRAFRCTPPSDSAALTGVAWLDGGYYAAAGYHGGHCVLDGTSFDGSSYKGLYLRFDGQAKLRSRLSLEGPPGSSDVKVTSLAAAPGGQSVYLAGLFSGEFKGAGALTYVAKGTKDAFVTAATAGPGADQDSLVWTAQLGTDGGFSEVHVAASPNAVYVAGGFTGAATIGTAAVGEANGTLFGFLARYESDGRFSWVRTWGVVLPDGGVPEVPPYPRTVTVDGTGAVVVAGSLIGAFTVDGQTLSHDYSASQVYVLRFSP